MPLTLTLALAVQHVNPASGIPCPVAHPHGGAAARLAQHAQWPEAHSAAHRLRTQPDLTAAWHPLRPTIQRRVEQNAVVRPPTAAHLGHPVFEHGHSGTDQPPKHRLNQSGTEVEAANACHPVQRGHQVALITNLFRLGNVLTRLRAHGSILQGNGERFQGDIEVVPAVHHSRHDGMAVGQHRHGVDAFRAGRLEPAVEISGERGTTGPRLDERVPAGRMSFGMENMTIDGDRSLPQQHGWTSKEQRSTKDHPHQTGRTEPVTPQQHAPRLSGWGHEMKLGGGETEFS